MKKFAKLAGIIAVAAVIGLFSSCGEQGGTIEVTNKTDGILLLVSITGKYLGPMDKDETKKYTYDLNTDVKVKVDIPEPTLTDLLKTRKFEKKVKISNGVTAKVEIK